ncbi:IS3 family transposase [Piscirickettsia salmonis]|uniref:IS3 family transposase n=1 Tax=Piscirickettsia salmonis TaxID=1238 RepID=UPI00166283F8|nr:IS3 family transposase [Piscirickettsia salmonis]QNR82221.1 transposase [Piscirickettsia salmonis]
MLATYLKDEHKLSLVVACNLVTLPRASYYRKKQHQSDNAEIISELKTLASKHKRWGCDKMVAYLKNKGKPWNHKRIRRVYIEMGLNISCNQSITTSKTSLNIYFSLSTKMFVGH